MRSLVRVFSYTKKYWKWILLAIPSILLTEFGQLAVPQVLRLIFDVCLRGRHFELILPYAALFFAVDSSQSIFAFARTYTLNHLAQRTCYDIRNNLFDHILRLSFSYHDEAETGQLISRTTADVESLQQFIVMGIYVISSQTIMLIGGTAICLYMNWRLALVELSVIPFLAVAVTRFAGKIGPGWTDVQNQLGDMTSSIQQSLFGNRVIKAFAREDFEISKFDREAGELKKRRLNLNKIVSFYGPMMDFMAACSMALVLWYGGLMVGSRQITLGELVAFLMYTFVFVWPIRMVGFITNLIKNATASSERIFEILDTHAETQLRDGSKVLVRAQGHVEFRNVSFTYKDGSKALGNIDFEAKPGEMVALMGSTGSGKSTIINLLPRFYDVTEGAILIDGVDIREYRLRSLRRNIAIVSQEPFLFGDSVYENIAFGKPGAPIEDVVEAAKEANIHEFIDSLPDGYDTRIGERGVNLSGGQKQRVAIARSLLMDPPILILDDATSSVDTETEALIQKALASLTESRTTFVIAQRVSTVKRADKIVVLDKGRVAECGTHAELLVKGGLYNDIFDVQFGAVDEENGHAAGI